MLWVTTLCEHLRLWSTNTHLTLLSQHQKSNDFQVISISSLLTFILIKGPFYLLLHAENSQSRFSKFHVVGLEYSVNIRCIHGTHFVSLITATEGQQLFYKLVVHVLPRSVTIVT